MAEADPAREGLVKRRKDDCRPAIIVCSAALVLIIVKTLDRTSATKGFYHDEGLLTHANSLHTRHIIFGTRVENLSMHHEALGAGIEKPCTPCETFDTGANLHAARAGTLLRSANGLGTPAIDLHQQAATVPVPVMVLVPAWLRPRVPHWVSAVAWAPWGVALSAKALALTLAIDST